MSGKRDSAVPSDLLRLPRLFAAALPSLRLLDEHVLLRPPERVAWQEWSELRGESRRFLMPWEPSWSADSLTRTAFRRRLQRYVSDWRTDQGYSFFLFRRLDGAMVGGLGLSNVRRGVAETASLGYWIGERYARRGYMSLGLRLVLGFAFERLQLHRVEAACLPHNGPSRGLLLKTGFREEGYAREYLCIDGRWQDHMLFAMLREEWTGEERR
jgi:[ribosomal protein S5]-alanine N-acetyltransferase